MLVKSTATLRTPHLFQEKADSFVKTCMERAAWYLTPNLLIPFGGDFAFTDASEKFKEMDQIVAYVNSHSDVRELVVYMYLEWMDNVFGL